MLQKSRSMFWSQQKRPPSLSCFLHLCYPPPVIRGCLEEDSPTPTTCRGQPALHSPHRKAPKSFLAVPQCQPLEQVGVADFPWQQTHRLSWPPGKATGWFFPQPLWCGVTWSPVTVREPEPERTSAQSKQRGPPYILLWFLHPRPQPQTTDPSQRPHALSRLRAFTEVCSLPLVRSSSLPLFPVELPYSVRAC